MGLDIQKTHESIREKIVNIEQEKLLLLLNFSIKKWINEKKITKSLIYLFNYEYIRLKIRYIGVDQLISDYKYFIKILPNNQKIDSVVALLEILEKASHLFGDKSNSISSILYGYLSINQNIEFDNIKEQIDKWEKNIWLKSWNNNFDSIQGNLLHTKIISDQQLCALEISKNQSILYVGTYNGMFYLYDSDSLNLIYNDKVIGEVKGFYHLTENSFLVVSLNLEETYIHSYKIKDRKLNLESKIKLKDNIAYLSREVLHQFEISEDGNWLLTYDYLNEDVLNIRNTQKLEEVYHISLVNYLKDNGKILDFKFVNDFQVPKSIFDFFTHQSKKLPQVICTCIRSYDEGKIFKFHFKNKYRVIEEFVYQDCDEAKLIVKENKNIFYSWNSSGSFQKWSINPLKNLNEWSLPMDIKEHYLNGLFVVNNDTEVITFSTDGFAYWLDIETGKYLKKIKANDYTEVFQIQDNSVGYTSDDIYDLKIWDLDKGSPINTLRNVSVENIFRLKDKKYGYTIADGRIHKWDITKVLAPKKENFDSTVLSIHQSISDENIFYYGSSNGELKKIEINNGNINIEDLFEFSGEVNNIESFTTHYNNSLLISTGDILSEEKVINIFNIDENRIIQKMYGHDQFISQIRLFENNRKVASIAYDSKAIIWDITGYSEIIFSLKHSITDDNRGLSINTYLIKQDSILITVSQDSIQFWETNTGLNIHIIHSKSVGIKTSAISLDNEYLSYVDQNEEIFIIELSNFNIIQKHRLNKIDIIEFTEFNNETILLCSSKKGISSINIQTQSVKKYSQNLIGSANQIRCIKSENILVLVTNQGELVIWDFESCQEILVFNIGRPITQIEFYQREKILILGEFNGQIHLLQLQNGTYKTTIC